MVRRLVAIRVPSSHLGVVVSRLEALGHEPLWVERSEDGRVRVEVVLDKGDVGELLDEVAEHFPGESDLRAVVLEAAATLPAEQEPEPPPPEPSAPEPRPRWLPWKRSKAISREELQNQLAGGAEIDDVYLVTIVLSAIVAAIGLKRDSSEILVGAMVIAPLLGPNMALALSTTLGDGPLFARAIRANLVGAFLAFGVSLLIGLLFGVREPYNDAIAARTVIEVADILLALASGAAGALALTAGSGMSLVGVMIAVALMPPLVTVGMLAADGDLSGSMNAAILVAANVICVNLAGVATFLIRGLRPRAWWEAAESARRSRHALTVWIALLLAVAVWITLREFGLV